MTPVVNGLQKTYEGRLDVRQLNASLGEGRAAFAAYRLQGHPSYVILDPAGNVLWQALGPQSQQTLSGVIERAIEDSARGRNPGAQSLPISGGKFVV